MSNGKLHAEKRFEYPIEEEPRRGIRWYHWVIVVLLFLVLVNVQYDRANIRRELDENAEVIKQLQERLISKELSKIRKLK